MKKITRFLYCCSIVCLANVYAFKAEAQIISTIAGNGTGGYVSDGVQATATSLTPAGVVMDASSNMYFADYTNNRIRKIDPTGIITTVAGSGAIGYSGDGGSATAAKLNKPSGIVIDNTGNLIFTDYGNHAIRKINSSGIISTICGNGSSGFLGDGGPATAARLSFPVSVIIDTAGNILFTDANNHRVRKISPSGIISTIAGKSGGPGFSGDGGPATNALLSSPFGLALDGSGKLYVTDQINHRIRVISTSGVITTIAGTGVAGFSGDGGTPATAQFNTPTDITIDPAGNNIYITDRFNNCVRKISSGIITTVSGIGAVSGFSGDGGLATAAKMNDPCNLFIVSNGDIIVSDFKNNRIRKLSSGNRVPYFINKKPVLSVCSNSSAVAINTQLAIYDSDMLQNETWMLHTPPAHGIATVAYSVTSTGGGLTPFGTTYTPAAGYKGLDSFKVKVDDGVSIDIATVYVTVDSLPIVAAITGPTILIVGGLVTLLNDTAGGVWSASNGNLSINSITGVATGVSAGIDTISYTVTNGCGSSTVTRIDTIGLALNASCIHGGAGRWLTISPNPAHNQLSITLNVRGIAISSIKVVDATGREACVVFNGYTQASQYIKCDISELPAGVYTVVLQSSSGVFTEKIEVY